MVAFSTAHGSERRDARSVSPLVWQHRCHAAHAVLSAFAGTVYSRRAGARTLSARIRTVSCRTVPDGDGTLSAAASTSDDEPAAADVAARVVDAEGDRVLARARERHREPVRLAPAVGDAVFGEDRV